MSQSKAENFNSLRSPAALLIALVLFASPCVALAQFYSGNTFKPLLDAHQRMEALGINANIADVALGIRAQAYVSAVWDSVYGLGIVCNPTTVYAPQLVAITAKYVETRPKDWGYSAYSLTLSALMDAFPCPKPAPLPTPGQAPFR